MSGRDSLVWMAIIVFALIVAGAALALAGAVK